MSLQQNLDLAERAVQHTLSKMTKGASNKPIDLVHSDMRNKQENPVLHRIISNDLTSGSTTKHRDKIKVKLRKVTDVVEHILANADVIEEHGIGNCAEQSCVAFKYLYNLKGNPANFTMVNLGDNHTCLVVGATPAQVNGWHLVAAPPAWPADAVVCDPWFYEWFGVSADWTRKVRQILKTTEPTWHQVQVKVAYIAARVWINNPLYQG